uniref:Uncharacterized protein n=1 Tax=Ixodes ricinus TaxID=34613 RepID=A0A6B0UL96_IXORI
MSVHVFFFCCFLCQEHQQPLLHCQKHGCKLAVVKKNSASTLGTVKRAASLIFQVMEEFLQVPFCRSLALTMDGCAHKLPQPRCSERPSLCRGSLCASFVLSFLFITLVYFVGVS